MEKMKMQTGDIANENFLKLAALFPNAVTETIDENGEVVRAIDKDILMQEISTRVVEGNEERYQFTWPDKRQAIRLASTPIAATLRPCREESVNFDTTQNLYIEGDNLDVLKLLRETYLGKVKMIYIDPPYNTGGDFVYNDDFSETIDEYAERSNDYDSQGNRLVQNTESNGRFHTDWLNMIYPRLKVAKDLLADDGVIFISIDDNEQENLKKICDEIFGEDNFQSCICWRRRTNQPNDKSKMIAKVAENILVYSKNNIVLSEKKAYHGVPLSEERKAEYTNPDNDINGPWSTNPWKAATGRGGTRYTITTPTGLNFTETWYGNEVTFNKLLSENRVYWTDNGNGYPRIKIYLKDAEYSGQAAINFFTHEKFGSNQEGSSELETLLNHKGVFDNPKPVRLLNALSRIASDKDSIILDFFSGSATTAHAVMKLNAEDGGKRKFIMVQLPEVCEENSEAAKAGYKTICEIGKERIRRAGEKIKEEAGLSAANLDIGFRVFKVADSNMKDVYYSASDYSQDMLDSLVSNIKEDRTDLDLLYGCLLEWGVELSLPHTSETIDGVIVHTVNNGDLIACFDADIPESAIRTIAKRQPFRAVFRDSSFASAPQKINVEEIFKLLSPTTTVDNVRKIAHILKNRT